MRLNFFEIRSLAFKILYLLSFLMMAACDSSSLEDIMVSIREPSRKQIDYAKLGVNTFVNDGRFGSISQQLHEVRDQLGIRHIRVLFAWDDNVQPLPDSEMNFSFYDDIIDSMPEGMGALVVLTHVPSWMFDSSNWIDNDPRKTFVERWVRTVAQRYKDRHQVVAFQIWNEPNKPTNQQNSLLNVKHNPDNYVELLARAHNVVKELAPNKLVVNAATTAINQNYPDTRNYNRGLRDAGVEQFVDVFAAHYYGKQYENVVRSRGVQDFLNGINRPIWLTESGQQGFNNQLEYVERTWPFLLERIPGIDRIYYYQHTEAVEEQICYGLRNLDGVSDLFIHLRDRPK